MIKRKSDECGVVLITGAVINLLILAKYKSLKLKFNSKLNLKEISLFFLILLLFLICKTIKLNKSSNVLSIKNKNKE